MTGRRKGSKLKDVRDSSENRGQKKSTTPQSIIAQATNDHSHNQGLSQNTVQAPDKQRLTESHMVVQEPQAKTRQRDVQQGQNTSKRKCDTPCPSASKRPSIRKEPLQGTEEFLERRFHDFVSIVRKASSDFTVTRFTVFDLGAHTLGDIFEEIREDAIHSRVNYVDEIILFAAADMFKSPSKSHWYGPRFASALLLEGNLRVRYTLTRIILHAMQIRDRTQTMIVNPGSMHQLLIGLSAVLIEVLSRITPTYDAEEELRRLIAGKEEDKVVEERKQLTALLRNWNTVERNLVIVSKIMKGFCNDLWAAECMNTNPHLLDVLAALMRHPKIPESTLTELMKLTSKTKGLLSAMDRKDPLGCVPQIMMNVAEFCFAKRTPKWAAPRFLAEKDVTKVAVNTLSALVLEVMGDFALSLTQESLFFEPFCDFISELFITEAINESGAKIARIMKCLLQRFPRIIPIKDDFMTRVIPMLQTENGELCDLVAGILMTINQQHRKLVSRYKDSINSAVKTRNR